VSQKQIKKQPTKTETKEVEAPPVTDTKEELKSEIDELLDEIDGMLEENAEAFVRNYVQKGGE